MGAEEFTIVDRPLRIFLCAEIRRSTLFELVEVYGFHVS
jgi:hypothetical protein